MAVVLGTNSGFVSAAPVDDPAGTNLAHDNWATVTKDTSPLTAAKITEIGWWCDTASEEGNFEVALYAADGAVVPGEAGTRLYIDATNAKGTTAGWKTVAVDWAISESTVYWIGVSLADVATTTNNNYVGTGGPGVDRINTPTLNDPFNGGALASATSMMAFYALWAAAGGLSIPVAAHHYRQQQ